MLSPQYIVSVLSSWGLPLVDSPVSEQQVPGTADVESLLLPLCHLATEVLSVRLLCQRSFKDPSVLPHVHTVPQLPGN